jgi:hypothetical protein
MNLRHKKAGFSSTERQAPIKEWRIGVAQASGPGVLSMTCIQGVKVPHGP